MNVITTKGRGWQKRCWELAKAGEPFEVWGMEQKNILFLQELCAAYGCKHKVLPGKVVFRFPERHETHEDSAHEPVTHRHAEHKNSTNNHLHSNGRRH